MTQPTSIGPGVRPASVADHLAGAAVPALLLLTAWGNATAMLLVSASALAVSLVIYRESVTVRTILAVMLAATLAALVAFWLP